MVILSAIVIATRCYILVAYNTQKQLWMIHAQQLTPPRMTLPLVAV